MQELPDDASPTAESSLQKEPSGVQDEVQQRIQSAVAAELVSGPFPMLLVLFKCQGNQRTQFLLFMLSAKCLDVLMTGNG